MPVSFMMCFVKTYIQGKTISPFLSLLHHSFCPLFLCPSTSPIMLEGLIVKQSTLNGWMALQFPQFLVVE